MRRIKLIAIFIVLLPLLLQARVAKDGPVLLTQPDGYSFFAKLQGDEFLKVMTTTDGAIITQDKEGWWCYAWYDEQGNKNCSPNRVRPGTSSSSFSRNIPYRQLSLKAREKRNTAQRKEDFCIGDMQSAATRSDGVVKKHGIVLLVEFSDKKMTYSRDDFVALLTQKGYSKDGATGCATDYFNDQFGDGWEFSFDVSPILTLPRTRYYYGANDKDGSDQRPENMVEDACKLADEFVDFSLYDDNKDKIVENVFIFFAGADEADGAEEECIWSHAWYLESGADITLKLDNVFIDRYACASELSRRSDYKYHFTGIGTFCHEFSHTLGLPDMYDTDYCGESNTQSAALWIHTSLMHAGNSNNEGNTPPCFNAIEREILGIGKCINLKEGEYTAEPISENGDWYRMETDRENEYYLFECRNKTGWDKYIMGDGMLAYHVDKSEFNSGRSETLGKDVTAGQRWKSNLNEVNANPYHQCADLVEADGRTDIVSENFYTEDIYGIFFPCGILNSLSPSGSPKMKWWSGNEGKLSLCDIRRDEGKVRFTVTNTESAIPPKVLNIEKTVFQDAAIITWEAEYITEGTAWISWGKSDGTKEEQQVISYEPGKYAVTLEDLSPKTSYSCEIFFRLDNVPGEKNSSNFTTKQSSDKYPYIYLKSADRNDNGTFRPLSRIPLRMYNAVGTNTVWTFDSEEIHCSSDGFYTLEKSGTLKADTVYDDGTHLITVKQITIE